MTFSKIENAVLNESVIAGVIIHESRFTYEEKGMQKLFDLGELWEKNYRCPIPLGGIAVKRNLANEIQQKINRVLRRSVEYALANPESCMDFVKEHSQEMDEEVMRKHIELYVNNYSVDLGEVGRDAVCTLFDAGIKASVIPNKVESPFIEL